MIVERILISELLTPSVLPIGAILENDKLLIALVKRHRVPVMGIVNDYTRDSKSIPNIRKNAIQRLFGEFFGIVCEQEDPDSPSARIEVERSRS